MKQLSHRKSLKLSRLTNEQLKMKFDLNVLKEAWSDLQANRNPVIINLQNQVWQSIVRAERQLAKNMRKCKRLVKPLELKS